MQKFEFRSKYNHTCRHLFLYIHTHKNGAYTTYCYRSVHIVLYSKFRFAMVLSRASYTTGTWPYYCPLAEFDLDGVETSSDTNHLANAQSESESVCTVQSSASSTLAIFQSGSWAVGSQIQRKVAPTKEEKRLCGLIDGLKQKLLKHTNSGKRPRDHALCLDTTSRQARPVRVGNPGILASAAKPWVLQSQCWSGPRGGSDGVRLLISHEEHHLLGLLFGNEQYPQPDLPFVHVASLSQGDFCITAGEDDHLVTVVERKREDDLISGIKSGRFRQQRESLRQQVASTRVEYWIEAMPRWACSTATAVSADMALVDSAMNRSICRDGFRWTRTNGILHTLYLLLHRVWTLLEFGDCASESNNATSMNISTPGPGNYDAVLSMEAQLPKPPVVPIEHRAARGPLKPSSKLNSEQFLPIVIAAIPGASFYQGLGLRDRFPTIRALCQWLETQASVDEAVYSLQQTEWVSATKRKRALLHGTVRGNRASSSNVPPVKKSKLSRAVCQKLVSNLGFS
jgi:hypothetical protein